MTTTNTETTRTESAFEKKTRRQQEALRSFRFGIEIETLGLATHAAAAALAAGEGWTTGYGSNEARDPQGRTWKAVRDGSLPGTHAEIVSPILGYGDIEMLQEAVRRLRRAGATAPTSSTGIHIHVSNADGNRFDTPTLRRLAQAIWSQEEIILKALATDPNRSRYCRPTPGGFISALRSARATSTVRAAWYREANGRRPSRYDSSRYHAVNLNSAFWRGTVEFRWFNGSLHAGEIKTYIQFALALCAKNKVTRQTVSRRRTYNPTTARNDMRILVKSLGLVGDEFKTARHHLTKNLPGRRNRAPRS
jgi:hypothetical protein